MIEELPVPLEVSDDVSELSTVHNIAGALLNVSPCLDDIVLLHSNLALPPLFVRQLQRMTRPGRVTCLAADQHAPALYEPCPQLAFRLPRAFLLSSRQNSGDVAALAAQQGLLGPSVGLIRPY